MRKNQNTGAISKLRNVAITPPLKGKRPKENVYYVEEGDAPYKVHMILWDWDETMDCPSAQMMSYEVQTIEEGMRLYDFVEELVNAFEGLLTLVAIYPADRLLSMTCESAMSMSSWEQFPSNQNQEEEEKKAI